ncbi:MAG: prolipoprotein diacylglyceryl transferase [Lachnospiraceae bacterium]|nr:prolipoprotein diacylglyceryl transferase [Lachnospiraceae bacterium]
MIPYIYIRIPSYGLMAVIGIIAAVSVLYYRSVKIKKYSLPFKDLVILCGMCGMGCVIGSRIIFLITQIPDLIKNFLFSKFLTTALFGGYVFYGGFLGAAAGAWFFSKVKKYCIDDVMDFVVPTFALFHAFGRIGCFMSGCCYGFKLKEQFVLGGIHLNYFPLQLVETAFEFIMFFFLSNVCDGKKLKVYLLSYSVFRFINEFFRGDTVRGIWFGISTSQIIAALIIILILFSYINNPPSRTKNDANI